MFPVSTYVNCSQVLENCSVSSILICFFRKAAHCSLETESNVFQAVLSNWRLIRVHCLSAWVLLPLCVCVSVLLFQCVIHDALMFRAVQIKAPDSEKFKELGCY